MTLDWLAVVSQRAHQLFTVLLSDLHSVPLSRWCLSLQYMYNNSFFFLILWTDKHKKKKIPVHTVYLSVFYIYMLLTLPSHPTSPIWQTSIFVNTTWAHMLSASVWISMCSSFILLINKDNILSLLQIALFWNNELYFLLTTQDVLLHQRFYNYTIEIITLTSIKYLYNRSVPLAWSGWL